MSSIVKPTILSLPVEDFTSFLRVQGISAFHFVYSPKLGKTIASNPILQQIGDYFAQEQTDFDYHEGVFGQIGPKSGVLQGAFVHRTCRGAAAGGVRNWTYETVEDWFRDGLRLSKGMTHKNALAQLWWGGGKGVIVMNTGKGLQPESTLEQRREVYEEYGSFISSLKGCYVTAEDVGTTERDMKAVFAKTRFTTCIPPSLGGSGNPSGPTARGVIRGLEAAFKQVGKCLKDSSIAVQGAGNVGSWVINFLLAKEVGRIIVSDVNSSQLTRLIHKYPKETESGQIITKLSSLGENSILFEEVDAVSPCAVGGILNPLTIPQIKAKIICGAANNQLGDLSKDDKLIAERGILYVPDFLVNRMGIVNCADEGVGYVDDDPRIEMHLGDTWENSIYNLTLQVLSDSASSNRTPQQVAITLAESRSFELHPIWGHRGVEIIESLIKNQEWNDKLTINQNESKTLRIS
ncbi:hypothetical protein G9A89_022935 [Geosiphon pyriformis]|nr:hypothetical protein G9A89_022935 [Geosiphon pyriformis]